MGHKWEIEIRLPRRASTASRKWYGNYAGKRYFGSRQEALDWAEGAAYEYHGHSFRYEFDVDGHTVESHIISSFADAPNGRVILADLPEFDFVVKDGAQKFATTGQLVTVRIYVKRIY